MAGHRLLSDSASREFRAKPESAQKLINEALDALNAFGVPVEAETARRRERMALALLAVADVHPGTSWEACKSAGDGRSMKTRDIIAFINAHFSENLSPGSYDDIRRKDLRYAVLANIVISTGTGATNDPTRGYAIEPSHAEWLRSIGQPNWEAEIEATLGDRQTLRDAIEARRQIDQVPVTLPSGVTLKFSPGRHNEIQKAVIELFLPRYGYGSQVLYVGDSTDRFLVYEAERLEELGFTALAHDELPDVVAYSSSRNWIYLIEAVHSSGPISPTRRFRLERLTENCKASIVYVTAFWDVDTFRRFSPDIAWESEVWIADSPDHLIHFNGGKFLGPH